MHFSRKYIALVPSLLLLSSALQAEDTAITVTATRLGDTPEEQPYAVYQLDRQQLDERNARELVDALAYSPGVFIQRTAPSQASPFIRGLTGEQALLLFDGVRLSHAMMRPGPNQYAALVSDEQVGRIDTILGSSSTVTGSDGMTGALDFRLAEAGRGVDESVSSWMSAQTSSTHGGHVSAGVDGQTESVAWSLDASLAQFGDMRGGSDTADNLAQAASSGTNDDTIPNSGYDRLSFGGRLAWDIADQQTLTLALGRNSITDAPRPDGYFANSGKTDRISRYFDLQQFTYAHARHTIQTDAPTFAEVRSTVWWHQHKEEQRRERFKDDANTGNKDTYRLEEKDDQIDSYGIDMQVLSFIGDEHEMTWGVTAINETTTNAYRRYNGPDSEASATPSSLTLTNTSDKNTTVPDGSTYDTRAVFVQDDWHINETFSLVSGLRYTHVSWNADVTGRGYSTNEADSSAEAVTASARLLWRATDEQTVFIGASQGFRAPNLTNLTGSQDKGSSGIFVAGNPNLDPEQSLSFEVGHHYITEAVQTSVTVFYTHITDVIQTVYEDLDNDTILDGYTDNGEQANLYGGEMSLAYHLPFSGWMDSASAAWTLETSLSVVRARKDVPQKDGTTFSDNISRANRVYGQIALRMDNGDKWVLTPRIRWAAPYNDVADSDGGDVRLTMAGDADGALAGYAIMDIHTTYNVDENHSYGIGIENLANTTYREAGSATDGTGFSIILNGDIRF